VCEMGGEAGRAGVDVLVRPRSVRDMGRVARGREVDGDGVGGGGEGRESGGRCVWQVARTRGGRRIGQG